MANVVITGSTRGIGLGLAKEFRKLGHNVVVCSRTEAAVSRAVEEVLAIPGGGKVVGIPCEVSNRDAVQQLWNEAAAQLGQIDIWINNAGVTGPRKILSALTEADIAPVIATNIWGSIWGTQVPLAGMTAQGSGKIFNFEGFGSDGMTAPGFSIYGLTKRAITYFTACVNKELAGSPVLLGTISPGIVITDILESSRDEDPVRWAKAKKVYNILGDKVETVTPYLAAEALKATKPGAAIRWLTPRKAAWRFMSAGVTKRKILPDDA